MLSVIVYGRNDSHGYNLHKRAAISLNAIAEVLTAEGDEIVFVDYNSQDDLPTFPEAIADTLTPRARRLMRVLRVRSRHHERFRLSTHLVALEPVSRNIAIRRADPANRWVLSTNPDMLLVPRAAGASLSDLCADLPDHWYHLPRFELPEALWESFDRTDAAGNLARLRDYGRRFHLNEITYGNPTIRYDAPGDFQLFLRRDLEAIHGFDERMVSGWHVDSNIAVRMTLKRGAVGTLVERLFGYHCDHTRMASVAHGRDRVENDMRRFITDVNRPDIPSQAEDWGLADEEIEEFRLNDRGSVLVEALSKVLRPAGEEPTESRYDQSAYYDLAYNVDHAIPYLADILLALPRNTRFGWAGGRDRAFALFAELTRTLGFPAPVVAQSCPSDGAEAVPDQHFIAECDVFVFEFGAVGQDAGNSTSVSDAANLTRLAAIRRVFLGVVDHECAAIEGGSPPRRVIALNAIGNPYEQMVHNCLSVNQTPHNTRLRQGFVIADQRQAEQPLMPQAVAAWLRQAMGRTHPVPMPESVRLLTCLTEFIEGGMTPERRRANGKAAALLLQLLQCPAVVARYSAAQRRQAAEDIAAARPSLTLAGSLTVPVAAPTTPPLAAPCRLAQIEDWEDPRFQFFARRFYTGAFAASWFRRSALLWERLIVLAQLEADGVLRPDARVLVVAGTNAVDGLIDALTTCVGQVHVIDRVPPEQGTSASRPPRPLRDPSRLATVIEARGEYDALVLHCDTALGEGLELLASQLGHLKHGAPAVVLGLLRVDGAAPAEGWDVNAAFAPAAADAFAAELGVSVAPLAPPSLSAATLDMVAEDTDEELLPHMLVRRAGQGLFATAAWVLYRTAQPGNARLDRLTQVLRNN